MPPLKKLKLTSATSNSWNRRESGFIPSGTASDGQDLIDSECDGKSVLVPAQHSTSGPNGL